MKLLKRLARLLKALLFTVEKQERLNTEVALNI